MAVVTDAVLQLYIIAATNNKQAIFFILIDFRYGENDIKCIKDFRESKKLKARGP
jgi:hypothetical protein